MPWSALFASLLRSAPALAAVLLLASLPLYRGGVLPEDQARLKFAASALAIVLILTLVAHLSIRGWMRLRQRRPQTLTKTPGDVAGWAVAGWLALVLGYGWLAALLPRGLVHGPSGAIFYFPPREFAAGFGTIHQSASLTVMYLYTLAAALLVAVWRGSRHRFWRRVLRWSVAFAGTLAAVVGAAPALGLPAPAIWEVERVPGNVFGFFWYHANAASFLLLTLPITAWALRSAMSQRGTQLTRMLLLLAITAQGCGLLMNFSKAGHLLLGLQLLAVAALSGARWLQQRPQRALSWQRLLLIGVPLTLLITGLAWLNASPILDQRWEDFAARGYRDEGRAKAAALSWRMAADAPLGWGPGSFEAVFAHYSAMDPALNRNRWKHAHHDFGQLAAEWGWCGGLLLVSGPLLLLVWHLAWAWRRRGWPALPTASFYPSLALSCVLLHALVDFPLQNPVILLMTAAVAGLWLSALPDPQVPRRRPPAR